MKMVEEKYRGYFITGSRKSGYVAVSPYGKFSPKVFDSLTEAKNEIDFDIFAAEEDNK